MLGQTLRNALNFIRKLYTYISYCCWYHVCFGRLCASLCLYAFALLCKNNAQHQFNYCMPCARAHCNMHSLGNESSWYNMKLWKFIAHGTYIMRWFGGDDGINGSARNKHISVWILDAVSQSIRLSAYYLMHCTFSTYRLRALTLAFEF